MQSSQVAGQPMQPNLVAGQPMQPTQMAGQPMISFVPATAPTRFTAPLRFPRKTTMTLGILQVIIGVACVAINSAAIEKRASYAVVSHGIWGGVVFIVTGSLCIGASCVKNKCLIISTLVLTCVSLATAVVVFSMAVVAIKYDRHEEYCYYSSSVYSSGYHCSNRTSKTKIALDSLLLILSVLEGAAAIAILVLSSLAVCRCRKNSSSTHQTSPMQGGQGVMFVANPAMAAPSTMHPTAQPMAPVGFQPYFQPTLQPVAMQPQCVYPVMAVNSGGQFYQVQGMPFAQNAAAMPQPSQNTASEPRGTTNSEADKHQSPPPTYNGSE